MGNHITSSPPRAFRIAKRNPGFLPGPGISKFGPVVTLQALGS